MDDNLREYIRYILDAVEEVKYDGKINGWDESWTFPNALLFTISIMTLIGEQSKLFSRTIWTLNNNRLKVMATSHL